MKVLLYSGGMDSWLVDKLYKPDIKLFIDIGTKCNKEELKRLPKDVVVKKIEIAEFEDKSKNFLLPLRNLFFVEMASYYGDEVCLGATSNDMHFDNNILFAEKTQKLINYLYSEFTNKEVKIVMPYYDKTKSQVLKEYIEQGGDLQTAWEQTFSCYSPKNGKECGKCVSCEQKRKAFKENGFKF